MEDGPSHLVSLRLECNDTRVQQKPKARGQEDETGESLQIDFRPSLTLNSSSRLLADALEVSGKASVWLVLAIHSATRLSGPVPIARFSPR